MRIESAVIENFKGIERLELNLDKQFNVFIGNNGSGKTAVLEALLMAAGSLFIGVKDVATKAIHNDAIRYEHEEYQFPVTIKAQGTVSQEQITWSRERNSLKGSTTTKNAHAISDIGKRLDKAMRNGESAALPLISYFSTGRLFLVAQTRTGKQAKSEKPKALGSRLRGYRQSFDAKSNFKRFTNWFRLKEISQVQRDERDIALQLVKQAIVDTLPDCQKVYYDFNPDTSRGLTVELSDGRVLPFNYLSDGMRSFLAMIADIAHRCVLLNPFLGEQALQQTEGVVFIDELDLHLHPSWQKRVVNSLLQIFPKIQFITSTHSPFIIQETEAGQLFILEDCQLSGVKGASDLSIEDISEFLQGVAMPQWSKKKGALYQKAQNVYASLAKGEELSEIDEQELASLIKPFSQNPAFDALLAQERLKNKGE